MAHSVVWIDSNNAHVFDLSKTGIFETRLKRSEATHHTFNKKDHHGDPSIEHFYRDVAAKLGGTEELLILGPGLAKGHFRKYLETHYKELAKKIVGVEETDHPTHNQILALSRKLFKDYDLFDSPIRAGG